MAKKRVEVCQFYIAFGVCEKGHNASHKEYCQTCDKYIPKSGKRYLEQNINTEEGKNYH